MITLITGLPGAGKTLYAVSKIKEEAERDERDVYFHGINGLKLPWIQHPFDQWMTLPPKSIMVVDEVQDLMRPRAHGSQPPPFVAALETHRHKGIDLFFITQHPMLLDQNARRLVGRHLHIVRKFGSNHATVHEWASVKEGCDKSRADSLKQQWSYPKEAFAWYKSAEAHTVKRRIPRKLVALAAVPFIVGGLGYFALSRAWESTQPQSIAAGGASRVGDVGSGGQRASGEPLTPAQYVDQFAPRVAGLAYTAPVYDDITKPVRAPYPAACVRSATRCACYTQQGTALAVPKALCDSIVGGGFFVPWDDREPPEARHGAAERLERSQVFQASAGPGLINLGGAAAEAARLRFQDSK